MLAVKKNVQFCTKFFNMHQWFSGRGNYSTLSSLQLFVNPPSQHFPDRWRLSQISFAIISRPNPNSCPANDSSLGQSSKANRVHTFNYVKLDVERFFLLQYSSTSKCEFAVWTDINESHQQTTINLPNFKLKPCCQQSN